MSEISTQKKIDKLMELLLVEKEEDLKQFRNKMGSKSLVERRKNGVCWYPVKMETTRFDSGERLLVKVSRMPEHSEGHSFQSGKLVSFFSNATGNDEQEDMVTGVVNNVRGDEMLITINADRTPDWISDGYLGVQLLFDENSYKEMEAALEKLRNSPEKNIQKFRQIAFSDKEPLFDQPHEYVLPQLNESQNKAVTNILSAQDIAIVHGPPGTGKTTTLIESIAQVLKNEHQILVAAPSNAAVDLLVQKLVAKGVRVLRIGHPARVNDEALQTTLDAQIAHHNSYKELRAVKRKAEEYKKLARKYKRNFGADEREQRKLLKKEASQLYAEADQLEYYIASDIIDNAQVIAATLVGVANRALKGRKFNTVFIDEAAQALEPATWIPILRSKRVVLAGDHQQLPPTIKSVKAASDGLQNTLFEKIIKKWDVDVMLKMQYRMHEQIMKFSSEIFYDKSLVAHDSVAHHLIFENDSPLEFVDTAGTGFEEQLNPETFSSFNKEEAILLLKHFTRYITTLEDLGSQRNLQTIGIISPYKAQTTLLKKLFLQSEEIPDYIKTITSINTVDSFQGQERDLIYISLVRSNPKNNIGFLSDIRRMNVAMTRARKKLVVVGESGTISKHEFYKKFIDYTEKNNAYHSAFEWLYE